MTESAVGTSLSTVPFNRVEPLGNEYEYIAQAVAAGHLSCDGPFTARCQAWLEETTGAGTALLTHSCTGALELAVTLAQIGPGDEVVMPSYTFSSTANAVAIRGGVPVFVDVREDTLNIDPQAIEAALTSRTKALLPVHYAGVGADMDDVLSIARDHDLRVIEDAAQGLLASRDGRPLGTIGDLGAISFHETKNTTAGEGGVLLVNDPELVERAEIVRTKGTNRSQFLRGHVDKYTWVDIGSSYGLSEINAAFLFAQLENARTATARRLEVWRRYDDAFEEAERAGLLARPFVPLGAEHNAHMYYVLLPSRQERDRVLDAVNAAGIKAVFHYIPLHDSPAGERFGRVSGGMAVTNDLSGRLLRLPMYNGLVDADIARVTEAVLAAID